jgi:alpha-beta hydrolase superfamily lysophospholipase
MKLEMAHPSSFVTAVVRRNRVAAFLGVLNLLCVLFVLRVAVRAYSSAMLNFTGFPPSAAAAHPEVTGIPGLHEIAFEGRDGRRIAGWYAPSRNRAAVILLHGTHSDRASELPATRTLAAAGFGVLALDWPGYGRSEGTGPVRWNVRERRAMIDALSWLSGQPDVDSTRIGAYGHSMGGYILAQVAPCDGRVQAAWLSSAPSELIPAVRNEYSKWPLISGTMAELALRRAEVPFSEAVPVNVLGAMAPRPIFIVGGDQDRSVAPVMARRLYASAREPKTLWIIPNATHGGAFTAAPREYPLRLVAFFRASLLASTMLVVTSRCGW